MPQKARKVKVMARTNRVKKATDANYHVMSRCNNKEFIFKNSGLKGSIVKIIKDSAAFSGVKLYAYSVMDNHFHIATRVLHPDWFPTDLDHLYKSTGDKPQNEVAAEPVCVNCEREGFTRDMLMKKVIKRISYLKSERVVGDIWDKWMTWDATNRSAETDEDLRKWLKRMHDVSQFTKTLKELINIEFKRKNRKHCGSIFAGRFNSTLIEGGEYLATCIRYIELNSVRAGIVKHAKEYEFSSHSGDSYAEVRCRMGTHPVETVGTDPNETVGTDPNDPVDEVMERWLMRRVVQFGAGVVLGSKAFVEREIGARLGKAGFLAMRAKVVLGNAFSTHGHKLAAELEQEQAA